MNKTVRDTDIYLFGFILLAVVALLFVLFLIALWKQKKGDKPSPYTGKPLRPVTDLSYMNLEHAFRFIYDLHDDDNPLFDITKAVYCRQTGRIFPDAYDLFGNISVDWSFIHKRASGEFVSWGSLTEEQQIAIMDCHETVKGFQIKHSSPDPDPARITQEYAYTVPGPLYVDVKNKVLLGWKEVPETDLEVLVLQKPTRPGKYML